MFLQVKYSNVPYTYATQHLPECDFHQCYVQFKNKLIERLPMFASKSVKVGRN